MQKIDVSAGRGEDAGVLRLEPNVDGAAAYVYRKAGHLVTVGSPPRGQAFGAPRNTQGVKYRFVQLGTGGMAVIDITLPADALRDRDAKPAVGTKSAAPKPPAERKERGAPGEAYGKLVDYLRARHADGQALPITRRAIARAAGVNPASFEYMAKKAEAEGIRLVPKGAGWAVEIAEPKPGTARTPTAPGKRAYTPEFRAVVDWLKGEEYTVADHASEGYFTMDGQGAMTGREIVEFANRLRADLNRGAFVVPRIAA